jgi:hypothetical protein
MGGCVGTGHSLGRTEMAGSLYGVPVDLRYCTEFSGLQEALCSLFPTLRICEHDVPLCVHVSMTRACQRQF